MPLVWNICKQPPLSTPLGYEEFEELQMHRAHYIFNLVQVQFTLVFVGNLADLIFVFFDPIGQALCKRTLNLVGKLTV